MSQLPHHQQHDAVARHHQQERRASGPSLQQHHQLGLGSASPSHRSTLGPARSPSYSTLRGAAAAGPSSGTGPGLTSGRSSGGPLAPTTSEMTRSTSINVAISRPTNQRSFSNLSTASPLLLPSSAQQQQGANNGGRGGAPPTAAAAAAAGPTRSTTFAAARGGPHGPEDSILPGHSPLPRSGTNPAGAGLAPQQRSLSGGPTSPYPSSTSQEYTQGQPYQQHQGQDGWYAQYTTASPVATPDEVYTEDPLTSANLGSRQQQQSQQRRAMTASPAVYALEAHALSSLPVSHTSPAGAATNAQLLSGQLGKPSSINNSGSTTWQQQQQQQAAHERAATTIVAPRRSDTLGPASTTTTNNHSDNSAQKGIATDALTSSPPSVGPDQISSSASTQVARSGAGIGNQQRANTIDGGAESTSSNVASAGAAYPHAVRGGMGQNTPGGGGPARTYTTGGGGGPDPTNELNAPFRSMTLAGVEHHQMHGHQGGVFHSATSGAPYPLTMSPPMHAGSNLGAGGAGGRPGNGGGRHNTHGSHPSISYGYHPAEPFTLGSPHMMSNQSPEPFLPGGGGLDGHPYDAHGRGAAAAAAAAAGRVLYSPVAGMPGLPPSMMGHHHPMHHHPHHHPHPHHMHPSFNPHSPLHSSPHQTPHFGPVPMPGMVGVAQQGGVAAQRSGSGGASGGAGGPMSPSAGNVVPTPMSPLAMPAHMVPSGMMMSPGSPIMGMQGMDKKVLNYGSPLPPALGHPNLGRGGGGGGGGGGYAQGGQEYGSFSPPPPGNGRHRHGGGAGSGGGYGGSSGRSGSGSGHQQWGSSGSGGAGGGGGGRHRRGPSSSSSSGGFALNPFGAAGAALSGFPVNAGSPITSSAGGWGVNSMSPLRAQASLLHNDAMGMAGMGFAVAGGVGGNPYGVPMGIGLAPGYDPVLPMSVTQAAIQASQGLPGVGPMHGGHLGGGARNHSQPARSPALEEFRSRHPKHRRYELEDIKGHIVEFSEDQHGSRFIQEKLDQASAEEVSSVFSELLPNAVDLMTDVFGNYVVQKVFDYGTPEERKALLKTMQGQILSLSLGTYGCRVVQTALEKIELADKIAVAEELRGYILQCVKDQNANHVIQKVVQEMDVDAMETIDFIPEAFRGQVQVLAAHCYSCRVLQRIFENCTEAQKRPLLEELLEASQQLMQNQYGNYVVQWVLQQGEQADKEAIIQKTKGNILLLSRHKFASNVVEEIIRAAPATDKADLIEEILTPVSSSTAAAEAGLGATNGNSNGGGGALPTPVVLMMKDQYANYVLQRFLEVAEGEQFVRLAQTIQPQLANMRRFSSGLSKHLTAIERILGERGPAMGLMYEPSPSTADVHASAAPLA
ncbi:mRNA binding protein puf3 [Tilletia horrida]|nr:mRNA binding protein puf3 [Tilletia horrida]